MRWRGFIVAAVSLALPGLTATGSSGAIAPPAPFGQATGMSAAATPLSAFEWRHLERTPMAELTASFPQFAALGGTTISVDISHVVDISEIPDDTQRAAAAAQYDDRLRAYLAAARSSGLTVEAVAGAPHWIDPDVRYVTGIVLDHVTGFNGGQPAGQRLAGVQFDLEPWATPEWATEKNPLTQQLLATVAGIARRQAAVPRAQRVPIAVAMPFWLDGTAAPTAVDFEGVTASPAAHVLRLMDNRASQRNAVVVMAYRDTTSGADGSIAVSAREFELARRHAGRVRVVIGQELAAVDPPRTTFHEEGLAALLSAGAVLTATFGGHPAWGGLAIDHMAALAEHL